jgi:Bacterial pre-peptidase C-terminal domain
MGNVSQITPTGTTCTEFNNGTAETLSSLSYSVKSGKISQVAPGVFFYWVKVTVPAGNNVFTITEAITTGNFSTKFALANGGNNVFNSSCTAQSETITQDPDGTVHVSFNAPTAGTYIISLKYDSGSVKGAAAPSPTTVHYNFSTTGVPGSTSGIDLIKQ